MDNDSGDDLISELPQSIIESIITRLPIKDAVRTSILSSKWRYKWASMTHIVFDDRSVTNIGEGHEHIAEDKVIRFISSCLFLHDGPIHKFSLSTSYLRSCPEIDQWLLFISRKDVKELVVELGEGEWFRAPFCIFSLKMLNRLELVRCELEPPLDFKGFLFLKVLSLQQVLIPPEDIECLISSCPLLESLTLSYFDSIDLTIRAPNLKSLILEGEFMDLCLENTPHLAVVSVATYMTDDVAEHLEQSSSCNFDKFLGRVPELERLSGHIYFTKFLSVGCDVWRRFITYHRLKFIELQQVSFDDEKEVLVVLQLIASSPNLQELNISGSSNTSPAVETPDYDYFEDPFILDSKLNRLKLVKMSDVINVPLEMKLIEFLLEHSPCLEIMSVAPSLYSEGRINLMIDLLSFRRASPRAKIVVVNSQV